MLFQSYTLPSQFYTKPARSKALPCRRRTILCHCSSMHFPYVAVQFQSITMPMQYAAFPMLCTSKPLLCQSHARPKHRCAKPLRRLSLQSRNDAIQCHCSAPLRFALPLRYKAGAGEDGGCSALRGTPSVTAAGRRDSSLREGARDQRERAPMGLAAAAERREALSRCV